MCLLGLYDFAFAATNEERVYQDRVGPYTCAQIQIDATCHLMVIDFGKSSVIGIGTIK
jgi:hypothetical protein